MLQLPGLSQVGGFVQNGRPSVSFGTKPRPPGPERPIPDPENGHHWPIPDPEIAQSGVQTRKLISGSGIDKSALENLYGAYGRS